jgi:hypothetical protein
VGPTGRCDRRRHPISFKQFILFEMPIVRLMGKISRFVRTATFFANRALRLLSLATHASSDAPFETAVGTFSRSPRDFLLRTSIALKLETTISAV